MIWRDKGRRWLRAGEIRANNIVSVIVDIFAYFQGDYEIKVTLKNGSTVLGCYDFKASLKAAGRYALVTKKWERGFCFVRVPFVSLHFV